MNIIPRYMAKAFVMATMMVCLTALQLKNHDVELGWAFLCFWIMLADWTD